MFLPDVISSLVKIKKKKEDNTWKKVGMVIWERDDQGTLDTWVTLSREDHCMCSIY